MIDWEITTGTSEAILSTKNKLIGGNITLKEPDIFSPVGENAAQGIAPTPLAATSTTDSSILWQFNHSYLSDNCKFEMPNKCNIQLRFVKVWENASTSSTFAAQTVNFASGTASYRLYLIFFNWSTSNGNTFSEIAINGQSMAMVCGHGNSNHNSGFRRFRIGDTYAYFNVGRWNGATSNTNMIPRVIYGIAGDGFNNGFDDG